MNQMKACIREVTRGIDNVNLMAPDMLQLGKTGKLPNKETERLDKIAMHAITTAEPEAAVEGVNGGANGKISCILAQCCLCGAIGDAVWDLSKTVLRAVKSMTSSSSSSSSVLGPLSGGDLVIRLLAYAASDADHANAIADSLSHIVRV